MKDGPTRIILAAAGLVGVWILTYWLWPVGTPAITFDSVASESIPARTSPASPVEESSAPTVSVLNPRQTDLPQAPGARLEPAPPIDYPAVVPPEFDERIVAPGDTIWKIAEQVYGDANLGGVIARANPTVDPKKLQPGKKLLIPKDPRNIQGGPVGAPPPDTKPQIIEYIVAPGDTLGEIAARFYGSTSLWTRIRDANPDLVGPQGQVREGARLVIPPPPKGQG